MPINESWLLSIVIFLPLVGAIVIGFAPTQWARQLALVASLATWVVSLWLAVEFTLGSPGGSPPPLGSTAIPNEFQFVQAFDWIPLFGIQYKLGVDGLSLAWSS